VRKDIFDLARHVATKAPVVGRASNGELLKTEADCERVPGAGLNFVSLYDRGISMSIWHLPYVMEFICMKLGGRKLMSTTQNMA
jgi:hypothetical protein